MWLCQKGIPVLWVGVIHTAEKSHGLGSSIVIGAVSVENLLHTGESQCTHPLAKPLYHVLAAFPWASVGANAFMSHTHQQGGIACESNPCYFNHFSSPVVAGHTGNAGFASFHFGFISIGETLGF